MNGAEDVTCGFSLFWLIVGNCAFISLRRLDKMKCNYYCIDESFFCEIFICDMFDKQNCFHLFISLDTFLPRSSSVTIQGSYSSRAPATSSAVNHCLIQKDPNEASSHAN